MKKVFLVFALIAFVALTGCQTSTPSSTTNKTLPDSSCSNYASTGVGLASGMVSSMANWAQLGGITSFGVKGIQAKSITGPDANGYYRVQATTTEAGYSYTYDIYAKVSPANSSTPTDIYIYGSATVAFSYAGSSYSYAMSYGTASNPYHGTVTWSGSNVASVSLSGVIALTVTAPGTSGNDTIDMTMTYASLSMPITTGADYPTGTVTVAIKYNGVAQPDMVITFNGTSTATWAYGGTSSSFTVTAASVK